MLIYVTKEHPKKMLFGTCVGVTLFLNMRGARGSYKHTDTGTLLIDLAVLGDGAVKISFRYEKRL